MKRPSKPVALVALTLAAVLMALALAQLGLFRTLELKTLDLRFRLLGDQEVASSDIVLVAIDDASLKTLEPLVGRWPWPRDVHAVLLQYLDRAGARLVVFDLLFTERDAQFPQGDADFGRTIATSGNVLHSVYLGNQDTGATDTSLLAAHSIPAEGDFDTFADAQFPIPDIARFGPGTGSRHHHSRRRRTVATLSAAGRARAGVSSRRWRCPRPWRPRIEASTTSPFAERQIDLPDQSGTSGLRTGACRSGSTAGRAPMKSTATVRSSPPSCSIREGQEPGLTADLFKDKIVIVGISAAGTTRPLYHPLQRWGQGHRRWSGQDAWLRDSCPL